MGPLKGLKIIEMNAIGPVPFAGMMLADMGAEVIIIERHRGDQRIPDCNRRGKKSIALNLKKPAGVKALFHLIEQADVLIEGFRPGVMERLGLGPDICLKRNPRLVYGRMTGWGQDGPLAQTAGHDINYISLTGALHAIGHKDQPPVPPLNLVGDYGGGAMFLVSGILAAIIEAKTSGKGQVVDAAMTDGSAYLMAIIHTLHAMRLWSTERGTNMLDTGAHYYNTYKTKDDKYISVGAIEPKFYNCLLEKMDVNTEVFKEQNNTANWPVMKAELAHVFASRTRDEWCDLLEGTDACFAPVLDYVEASEHAHNKARNTYIMLDGIVQPAPAPRFSKTPSEVLHGAHKAGEDTEEVLKEWGMAMDDIMDLKKEGTL